MSDFINRGLFSNGTINRTGKHLGRPRAEYPDYWNTVYKEWQVKKITAVQAMKALKLTKSTFYKLVRQYTK
jgi:hypothetical protein